MNYEKKYNEALERFKAFKEKYYIKDTNIGDAIYDKTGKMQKDFEDIFPELRESDDERTRKEMIKYFTEIKSTVPIGSPNHFDRYIAYLEKQKGDKDELVYRLNGLMQDYIKEGKDDEEKEHRFKCYQLFWDALEDANFFEQKEQKSKIIIPKFHIGEYIKPKPYNEKHLIKNINENGYVLDVDFVVPFKDEDVWEVVE